AFGVAIVAGGILIHYLVARGLAAWRDKSRAQQSMMNRAHTLQMAAPVPLRKSPIVAVVPSGQDWRVSPLVRSSNGGVLVHIGVRSICAGIAALAIGFALESVGQRVVAAASAGLLAESALFSVFETIRPKSLDHRASLVRVASLETGFAFEPAVEESERPAST